MLRERRCEKVHNHTYTMGLLEDTSPEIQQPIKFSELDTIGPHCSRMHMPMSESVTSAKGVVEDKLKQ